MQVFFARPVWKKGDVIRDLTTGKPFLVLHIFIDACTMVVDLEAKGHPTLPVVILPRDYDQYAKDCDMQCEVKEDHLEFDYDPVTLT